MKKTKQTKPDKIREYNIIQDDFIKACQVKRSITADEDFKRTIAVTVVLILIGSFFCFQMIYAQIKLSGLSRLENNASESVLSVSELKGESISPAPKSDKVTAVQSPVALKTMGGAFKSFMDYNDITRKTSKQYHLQQIATTDKEGFRRVGKYYCVAMGTFYGKYIGQTLTVQFESETISVIIAEVKDDRDTIDEKYCRVNGSLIEFVIDELKMDKETITKGSVQKFKGEVVKIESEGN